MPTERDRMTPVAEWQSWKAASDEALLHKSSEGFIL